MADTKDKILCAILYAGIFVNLITWVPVIWIIVANIRGIHLKDFIKYHCYQAVLFNMIVFFLPGLFDLLLSFVSNILDLFVIFANSVELLKNLNTFTLQIYSILVRVLSVYAIVWTARGKYTYIPPISQAINLLLR